MHLYFLRYEMSKIKKKFELVYILQFEFKKQENKILMRKYKNG